MTELFMEFTRPSGCKPISWAIRAIQGTPYSHVRFRWINSMGVEIIYEASGSNVKFIGPLAASSMKVDTVASVRFTLDRPQYRELVRVCMTYAGVTYGKLQLIGIGLAQLFNLNRNPLSRGTRQQVCSELAGRVMEEVLGQKIPLDWDMAGPKEIHDWATNITQTGESNE